MHILSFYETIKFTLKSRIDELVKSQKAPVIVIPVKTGIQENQLLMDSRFRGSDGLGDFLRDHQELVDVVCLKKRFINTDYSNQLGYPAA